MSGSRLDAVCRHSTGILNECGDPPVFEGAANSVEEVSRMSSCLGYPICD
jgi:hypothetical protein